MTVSVKDDCRHYVMQSVRGGRLERCRLDAAEGPQFACPEDCLFYEPRDVRGPVGVRPPGDPGPPDPESSPSRLSGLKGPARMRERAMVASKPAVRAAAASSRST